MEIKRIDHYTDERFSRSVLYQHGAYLIDEEPYEIEIIGPEEATVRGKDPNLYRELIETFRFHAPHIVRFYDQEHAVIAKYPAPDLLEIELDKIQPSQFYIDEEKLEAVETFIRDPEDIVIQLIPYGDRFISLDGHTRLYLAVRNGYKTVKAVMSETDDWVWVFVEEAQRRKIFSPKDMILLPHEQYRIKWDKYCDEVFSGMTNE